MSIHPGSRIYFLEYRVNSLRDSPHSVLLTYTMPIYNKIYTSRTDIEGRISSLIAQGFKWNYKEISRREFSYDFYDKYDNHIVIKTIQAEQVRPR